MRIGILEEPERNDASVLFNGGFGMMGLPSGCGKSRRILLSSWASACEERLLILLRSELS